MTRYSENDYCYVDSYCDLLLYTLFQMVISIILILIIFHLRKCWLSAYVVFFLISFFSLLTSSKQCGIVTSYNVYKFFTI